MLAGRATALCHQGQILTCVSIPGQPFGTPGDATDFTMALSTTLLSGTSQMCLARGPGVLVLPPTSPRRGQPAWHQGPACGTRDLLGTPALRGFFVLTITATAGHFKPCQSC